MKYEIVRPNVSNFVKSLRDMGYTFEIAVADILDNSISAKAKKIQIQFDNQPELCFALLDNGVGMTESELVEAMRLGSKSPDDKREKNDLGRFGLGLKTASFSQCKQLILITKQQNKVFCRKWDLDYIELHDEWHLITPLNKEIKDLPLYESLLNQSSGTLVIWRAIDSFEESSYLDIVQNLRNHLSLVFHRFLAGNILTRKIDVSVNGKPIVPFNPFNESNTATQALPEQKFKINGSYVKVRPFILPHHSKMSRQEFDRYATVDGYTKSQGFYLYREGRLLIHGTWWGLNKVSDAHKLVRIRIDTTNEQDQLWNIDIKKSTATPDKVLKDQLKRILGQVLERGSRPYTGRGRNLIDNKTTKLWMVALNNEEIRFSINKQHPIISKLMETMEPYQNELLISYLKGLEAYLPLATIQSHLMTDPYKVNQSVSMEQEDKKLLAEKLKEIGLEDFEIEALLKTEIFKDNEVLLKDGEE